MIGDLMIRVKIRTKTTSKWCQLIKYKGTKKEGYESFTLEYPGNLHEEIEEFFFDDERILFDVFDCPNQEKRGTRYRGFIKSLSLKRCEEILQLQVEIEVHSALTSLYE